MNQEIFYFFYNFAHQLVIVDNLIVFFALYFPYLVVILALFFLLFHYEIFKVGGFFSARQDLAEKQKKKEIIFVFFSGVFAWTLAYILKFFIFIDRPVLVLSGVDPLFFKTGPTFPSGHATFFMALAFALFFTHKKAGYVFMVFAFFIGIARIMAGVHFPIDILGGYFLGAIISTSFYLFKQSKK